MSSDNPTPFFRPRQLSRGLFIFHERTTIDGKKLYGIPPTKENYKERCLEIADTEAQAIEFVFARYGVNARIDDEICVFNRQYFGFAIETKGGKRGSVQDVIRCQRELSNALSRMRGKPTRVRIQDVPLTIEVPNPWPRSLPYTKANLNIGPDRLLVGVEYDAYAGPTPLVFDFGKGKGEPAPYPVCTVLVMELQNQRREWLEYTLLRAGYTPSNGLADARNAVWAAKHNGPPPAWRDRPKRKRVERRPRR